MRIKHHKHGQDSSKGGAIGKIGIGFDGRYLRAEGQKGADRDKTLKYPFPAKHNGFCIYHTSVDANNELRIDFAAMKALGYTEEQIMEARRQGMKAPDDLLPHVIHFQLPNGAVEKDGVWDYGGMFSEEYQCYSPKNNGGVKGLFCMGDGLTALRKNQDGTKSEIGCVPNGRSGATPDEFCPFSVSGECKCHIRLVVSLFTVPEGKDPSQPDLRPADFRPVSALGIGARYRLDTSSNAAGLGIGEVLDDAADRLDGNIGGLRGTLAYQKQRRLTPMGTPAVVQQIACSLNLYDIAYREQQLNNWRLGVAAPALQLPAPDEEPVVIGEEAEADGPEEAEEVFEQSPPAPDPPAEDDLPFEAPPEPEPEPPAPSAEPAEKMILDGQIDEIEKLCAAKGVDLSKVLSRYKVHSIGALTYDQAEKAVAALLKTEAKKGGK